MPKAANTPPTIAARTLLDTTIEHARTENKTAYNKTVAAYDFWEHSVSDAIDNPLLDPDAVQFSAIDEVALALALSRRNADSLITVGNQLQRRFPTVRAAFADGAIDYARVATIISVFEHACDATVAAAQPFLLGYAGRYTPGVLRAALWRLWSYLNKDEAARAREQNIRLTRTTYVRSGGNGTSWLTACISDLEGAEAQRLIQEIADTVCQGDPRSANEQRADGLMALLHGESVLVCRCDSSDCPMVGVEVPQRRQYLVQILVDIRTLLGLTSTPAVLDDGTPVPADIARMLAGDAQWQAILLDLSRLAPAAANGTSMAEAGSNAPAREPGPVGRGRVHKAGQVPTPSADVPEPEVRLPEPAVPAPTPEPVPNPEPAVAATKPAVAAPEPTPEATKPKAAKRKPLNTKNAAPLGDPYTYRPSAALVALVVAMYPTCTFPHCATPSRRCQVDHIIAFDHQNPALGGLTVLGNLQPVCKGHHQLKTKKLWTCHRTKHGVIWSSPNGLERITLAQDWPVNFGPNTDSESHLRFGYLPPHLVDEEVDHPTWWEKEIGADATGPTLAEIAVTRDPVERATLKALRRRYVEYWQVVARRFKKSPPPF